MSVTTTSGLCSSIARSRSGRSAHDRHELDLVGGLEQLTDPFAEQIVVLGEDHADRHGVRIGEPDAESGACLTHDVMRARLLPAGGRRLPLEAWETVR